MGPDDREGLDRRRFLKGAASASLGVAVAGIPVGAAAAADGTPLDPADAAAFPQGVVSGHPLPRTVTLWTRVAAPRSGGTVEVDWELAADPEFRNVVRSGAVGTGPGRDHTVKLAVGDLEPATTYWYRFSSDGLRSRTGRTRTAPGLQAAPERLRIAFCSCQDFGSGYYNAWRAIAGADVDFVMHLGDYIYETGGDGVRPDPTGTAATVDDFREKYRLYRTDEDLQLAHAMHPLVPTWDDHEVVNNYDRFVDPALRAAGYQAWFEYQPVWAPAGDPTRIYRHLRWGRLAEMFMLDLRQYRDREAPLGSTLGWPSRAMVDPQRTQLGSAQKQWLKDRLLASPSQWKVIGNSVMILPWRLLDLDEPFIRQINPRYEVNAGVYVNGDSWDGFQPERRELLRHLESNGIGGTVFLTGDVHSFHAGDVYADHDDPAARPVAHEFVGGSISSGFVDFLPDDLRHFIQQTFRTLFKELRYVNTLERGFGIATFGRAEAEVEYHVAEVSRPGLDARVDVRFRVPMTGGRMEVTDVG